MSRSILRTLSKTLFNTESFTAYFAPFNKALPQTNNNDFYAAKVANIVDNNNDKSAEKKITQEKKFNSSEIQEIKKIDIKEKPETEIKQNENIKVVNQDNLIKEKEEIKVKIKEDKLILNKDNIESLPSEKIKPKLREKKLKKLINFIINNGFNLRDPDTFYYMNQNVSEKSFKITGEDVYNSLKLELRL